MTEPHKVFGLSPGASAGEIRSRYLQLVREFPPDRDPERFARIRAAFEDLSDPVRRLEKQLFTTRTDDSLSALTAELRTKLRNARIPTDVLLALADAP
jgi:curved DNA-binding protein CbpA